MLSAATRTAYAKQLLATDGLPEAVYRLARAQLERPHIDAVARIVETGEDLMTWNDVAKRYATHAGGATHLLTSYVRGMGYLPDPRLAKTLAQLGIGYVDEHGQTLHPRALTPEGTYQDPDWLPMPTLRTFYRRDHYHRAGREAVPPSALTPRRNLVASPELIEAIWRYDLDCPFTDEDLDELEHIIDDNGGAEATYKKTINHREHRLIKALWVDQPSAKLRGLARYLRTIAPYATHPWQADHDWPEPIREPTSAYTYLSAWVDCVKVGRDGDHVFSCPSTVDPNADKPRCEPHIPTDTLGRIAHVCAKSRRVCAWQLEHLGAVTITSLNVALPRDKALSIINACELEPTFPETCDELAEKNASKSSIAFAGRSRDELEHAARAIADASYTIDLAYALRIGSEYVVVPALKVICTSAVRIVDMVQCWPASTDEADLLVSTEGLIDPTGTAWHLIKRDQRARGESYEVYASRPRYLLANDDDIPEGYHLCTRTSGKTRLVKDRAHAISCARDTLRFVKIDNECIAGFDTACLAKRAAELDRYVPDPITAWSAPLVRMPLQAQERIKSTLLDRAHRETPALEVDLTT